MPVTPPLPPAHLLMTADAVGGVWTYALDLARGLSGAGLRVTLALLGPSPQPDQRAAARAVPGLELIDTGLPLDWMAEEPAAIRRSAVALGALGALARRLGVDLVHLNSPALAAEAGFTSAAFAAATAALHGVPPPVVVRNGRSPSQGGTAVRERLVFTAGRLWDEGKNIATLDAAAATLTTPLIAAGPLEGPDGSRRTLRHAQGVGRLDAAAVAAWVARAGSAGPLPRPRRRPTRPWRGQTRRCDKMWASPVFPLSNVFGNIHGNDTPPHPHRG